MINRGDRREAIFADDLDRKRFVATLDECCTKTGWQVHAWCLMPNHFHLVVETPRGNLVTGLKWFLGTYTVRYNRRHKLSGHLFGGRYKALMVDGSGNGYLKTVCDYVHLNPARAGLLQPEQQLKEFVWSSYPQYLQSPPKRPAWLRVDRLLGEYGIPRDSAAGRGQLQKRVEQRRAEEDGRTYEPIRQGWCLGEEEFRKELLGQIAGRVGEYHRAEERHESDEASALSLMAGMLKQLGWTSEELRRRRKGDPAKVRLAMRLRAETPMTLKWIAEQLHMGAWTHVSNLLSRERRGGELSGAQTARP